MTPCGLLQHAAAVYGCSLQRHRVPISLRVAGLYLQRISTGRLSLHAGMSSFKTLVLSQDSLKTGMCQCLDLGSGTTAVGPMK